MNDLNWKDLSGTRALTSLRTLFTAYLHSCRWFAGKGKTIRRITLEDAVQVAVPNDTAQYALVILNVYYRNADAEQYLLPLAIGGDEPGHRIGEAHYRTKSGTVYDATSNRRFLATLLETIGAHRGIDGLFGSVLAAPTSAFDRLAGDISTLEPRPVGVEQSNTSILFGDRLILKLVRRLQTGLHPDIEIGSFLTEGNRFPHTPALAGTLAYHHAGHVTWIGMLHQQVRHKGDAWKQALDAVTAIRAADWSETAITPYIDAVSLLGRRTAELHLALAGGSNSPGFAPEPFTPEVLRALSVSVNESITNWLRVLKDKHHTLPPATQALADRVLAHEADLRARTHGIESLKHAGQRIRTHGDYHLGQVLVADDDYLIVDFEGEPARSMDERRAKGSALRDVAGMIRSFHYASAVGAADIADANRARVAEAARHWQHKVATAFVSSYLETTGTALFIPADDADTQTMLDFFILEKAIYELGYELNNRPGWVYVPLIGILGLVGETPG